MSKYGGNTEFYNKVQTSSLSLKDVFSDVFKKHQKHDGEKLFVAGTSYTTPSETQMLQEWRKPWLFMRILGVGLLLILLLYIIESLGYGVYTAVLQIFSEAAVIPLAVLLFYWEMNIPRNIPIYEILFMILIGGVLSLIFTIILNETFAADNMPAQYAAFIEEPAKLAAACIFLRKPKHRYTMNGILIGGAIGCGFAVIETTGYYLGYGGDTLLIRGILAPGQHVLYAALHVGALAGIKGSDKLRPRHFTNPRFLGFFAAAVVLHFVNNDSDIYTFLVPVIGDFKFLILLVIGWTILLMLNKSGIKEILAVTQAACLPSAAESAKKLVLYGISGMYAGRSITLSGGEVVFGRNQAVCNLLFPGDTPGISRRHCTLSCDGQTVWLSDDNSSNGTFLGNGKRLRSGTKVQMKPGQRFYLADTQTMFELRQ
jgi:Predicted membrane protein